MELTSLSLYTEDELIEFGQLCYHHGLNHEALSIETIVSFLSLIQETRINSGEKIKNE